MKERQWRDVAVANENIMLASLHARCTLCTAAVVSPPPNINPSLLGWGKYQCLKGKIPLKSSKHYLLSGVFVAFISPGKLTEPILRVNKVEQTL